MSQFPDAMPPARAGAMPAPTASEIEQKLRRSEERYRSLVAATAQIVWVASAKGLVEEDLPSWRAYTGQRPEEILGWGWLEAVHPDDRPGTAHVWSQALATGSLYEIEYRIRRYDGVYRTFWVRGIPVREADGSVREWVGTCTDITERKRLEDELVESAYEATLRANHLEVTFEAMGDAVFIYDQQGAILSLNAAARHFLGRFAPLAEGECSIHTYLERLEPRDAAGQPLPREAWPTLRLLQGEVLDGGPHSDLLLRTPRGGERRVSVSGSPIRDEAGAIVGAVAIARDVTERYLLERRTHDALAALLALAEALVEIPRELAAPAPGATPLLTASSITASDQRASQTHEITHRLALLIRQVLNCRHVMIMVIEPGRETLELLAAAGEGCPAWQERLRSGPLLVQACLSEESLACLHQDQPIAEDAQGLLHCSNLTTGRYTAILAPLLLDQVLIGVVRIEHSEQTQVAHAYTAEEIALIKAVARLTALVTEHERLLHERAEARANELALRESNKRMDEFLSIASHELRTPLTTIKGNVQLARRHLSRLTLTEAEQQARRSLVEELLERADRQVGLLTRLVRDLLESSRAQADRLAMHLVPQDLVAIVRQTVADLHSTAPQRPLQLFIDGRAYAPAAPGGEGAEEPISPIMVRADAEGLGLVITNYLTNAFKYAPRERPVEVCVERDADEARVSVRDEGPGLPPAEQQRVWERFYRAPGIEAQGGATPGLGLGLHICKMIIERHQGRVGLCSAPGAGSTFWFSLPLLATADDGDPHPRSDGQTSA
jgi:PAS domain S-box-containing protein